MPAAASRLELRFSGSGGQGIMLAATVLAEAATALGREVVATQSYGPEARGGAAKAEVIVARVPIDFPEVTAPDITLCFSQDAFDAYAAQARAGGLVIYDERLVEPRPVAGVRLLPAPFTETAERRLGKPIAANMVALGMVQKVSGVVTAAALAAALRRRLPAPLVELNLRALRLGAALGAPPPRRRRSGRPGA